MTERPFGIHTQHCSTCGEDYDARELDAVLFHLGDHQPETHATGIVGRPVSRTCPECSAENAVEATSCISCSAPFDPL